VPLLRFREWRESPLLESQLQPATMAASDEALCSAEELQAPSDESSDTFAFDGRLFSLRSGRGPICTLPIQAFLKLTSG